MFKIQIINIDQKKNHIKFIQKTKKNSTFNKQQTKHINKKKKIFNPNQTPLNIYKNTTLNIIKHTPPNYI